MKRRLIIVALAVLLCLAAPITAFWLLYRALPPMDGTATLSGLDQSASVSFDEHGIPYIEAHTDSDAYLAQGYVTARDRMFQMEMLRRRALGEMAEVFGPSWLPADRLTHTLGIKHLAFSEYDKLSPAARGALQSYARGVNEYLLEYNRRLPIEFVLLGYAPREWRAEDCLAILKLQAYQIDESWRLDDYRQRVANRVGDNVEAQLFQDNLVAYGQARAPQHQVEPKLPTAKDDAPTSGGSPEAPAAPAKHAAWLQRADSLLSTLGNNADQMHEGIGQSMLTGSTTWAVPAAATANGGALLACNKDGPLTIPAEWYLSSLDSPGLHVAGAAMPGVPGIIVGRNEALAWGSSALKADVQDIFLEQFKSQFDPQYKTAKGWQDADISTDIIGVRFGQDVEYRLTTTEHGPVLMRSNQAGVALSWTGLNSDHPSFESLYLLNRARDANELTTALQDYSDPPMMFVFADRQGNIGYQAAGAIPLRRDKDGGTKLNLGWTAKDDWTKMIPFAKLPHGMVPFSKLAAAKTPIVAANQQPADANLSASLPAADRHLLLGHQWAPPYRANRLLSVLTTSKTPITVADMLAMESDQYSLLAPVLAETLNASALSTHLIDRNSVHAIDALSKWDGQLRVDGIEGSIYEAFLQTLIRRVTEPRLGRPLSMEYLERWPLWLTLAHSVVQNKPAQWMAPEERTYDCFFITTLVQSLKSLRIDFQTNNPMEWIWGNIHRAVFAPAGIHSRLTVGIFGCAAVPVGGAPECVDSCDVTYDQAAVSYAAKAGPTERMIVDMSDQDKFYQCIATGQSGLLLSNHRTDQLKPWAAVDMLPIAFSSDQLMKQCKHRLRLDPG